MKTIRVIDYKDSIVEKQVKRFVKTDIGKIAIVEVERDYFTKEKYLAFLVSKGLSIDKGKTIKETIENAKKNIANNPNYDYSQFADINSKEFIQGVEDAKKFFNGKDNYSKELMFQIKINLQCQ